MSTETLPVNATEKAIWGRAAQGDEPILSFPTDYDLIEYTQEVPQGELSGEAQSIQRVAKDIADAIDETKLREVHTDSRLAHLLEQKDTDILSTKNEIQALNRRVAQLESDKLAAKHSANQKHENFADVRQYLEQLIQPTNDLLVERQQADVAYAELVAIMEAQEAVLKASEDAVENKKSAIALANEEYILLAAEENATAAAYARLAEAQKHDLEKRRHEAQSAEGEGLSGLSVQEKADLKELDVQRLRLQEDKRINRILADNLAAELDPLLEIKGVERYKLMPLAEQVAEFERTVIKDLEQSYATLEEAYSGLRARIGVDHYQQDTTASNELSDETDFNNGSTEHVAIPSSLIEDALKGRKR